jgi:hypothetical protein
VKRRQFAAGLPVVLAHYKDAVLSTQGVHYIAKDRRFRPRQVRGMAPATVH